MRPHSRINIRSRNNKYSADRKIRRSPRILGRFSKLAPELKSWMARFAEAGEFCCANEVSIASSFQLMS